MDADKELKGGQRGGGFEKGWKGGSHRSEEKQMEGAGLGGDGDIEQDGKEDRLRKSISRWRKHCLLGGEQGTRALGWRLSPCTSQGYLGWETQAVLWALLASDVPCLLEGDKSLSELRRKETELCLKIGNYKKLRS